MQAIHQSSLLVKFGTVPAHNSLLTVVMQTQNFPYPDLLVKEDVGIVQFQARPDKVDQIRELLHDQSPSALAKSLCQTQPNKNVFVKDNSVFLVVHGMGLNQQDEGISELFQANQKNGRAVLQAKSPLQPGQLMSVLLQGQIQTVLSGLELSIKDESKSIIRFLKSSSSGDEFLRILQQRLVSLNLQLDLDTSLISKNMVAQMIQGLVQQFQMGPEDQLISLLKNYGQATSIYLVSKGKTQLHIKAEAVPWQLIGAIQ